jgi:MFS family permease
MTSAGATGGRAVFRFRDYRLYVSGRFLWGLAIQIQNVAIAWLVYDLTRDAFALGLIGLATFLPTVPLSLITGAIADRYDRQRVLVITYGLIALGALALCITVHQGLLWPVYVIVVGVGACRSFSNPAGQALMASTVPDEEYARAAAWTNSLTQTATIMGPAVGGLLYPLGPLVPFVVAFVCFAAATLMAFQIAPRPAKGRRKEPITWSMLVAGYKFIWACPVILGAITLDLVAVLLGGATALLPIFASEIFQTGPWGLGLLRSMPAVGSIVMALVLAHYPLGGWVGRTMFICVFIYGFATIGFGLSTSIWPAMVCLAVLGAADVVSIVIRSSLIQIETPDEMRGRVIAVHTILTGTSNNLGDFESGTLATFVGAVPAVIIGGVGALVGAALWIRLFPALWTRDKLTPG